MASIPLAALAVRAPESDPVGDYTKAVQLKQLLAMQPGQQQLQQQQIEAGQQDNQIRGLQIDQAQQQQRDGQALMQTLAQKPGATIGDVLPTLRGKISPQSYMAFEKADNEHKQALKTDFDNLAAQQGQYQKIYDSVQQMPDDQVQANWPQIAQAIQAIPGNKIPVDPNQPMSKQQIAQFGPMIGLNQAYLDKEQARKEKEVELKNKELLGKKTQAELDELGKKPGEDVPYSPAVFAQKKALKAGNDVAKDESIEAAAQSLASGDLTRLKDIASLRGDQRLLIYNRVKQIKPDFNTSEVDRKIKMQDDVDNGKTSQSIQSFGTFLEHAGEASKVVNEYRNTGSPLINKPLNWIRNNAAGDPAFQQFAGALEPVRKEFEGFLLGGRALYGDDRKAAQTILSDNSSPAQIQSALKQMGHTVGARYNEVNARYKRVMQKDLGPEYISDEARAGAQQIGLNLGGSSQPAASSGMQVGQTVKLKSGKTVKVTAVHPDGSFDAQ